MPNDNKIVRVLDLLTLGRLEALTPTEAQPALQLRTVLGTKNVVGIGISEKTTSGKRTGELALSFYVKRKLPQRRLKPSQAVPPEVPTDLSQTRKAIPTDVVALGGLRLDGEPIRPGGSLAHFKVMAGTFGALVLRNGKPELLSNSHVLALSGKAKEGDAILFPSKADGGERRQDVVAKLSRLKEFVPGGAFVNTADCATAVPVPERLEDLDPAILGLGLPRGIIDPKRGMKIVKVGRTTGKTTGVIRDIHFRVVFQYEGLGDVGFLNQVLCTRYSSPGDSGSLVLDRNTKRAVGLHFASAPNGSVFNRIREVLTALDVELVTKA